MAENEKPKRGTKDIKWKDDYIRMAEVACTEGGLTDVQLAKLFEVAKQTIYYWKREKPGFLEAIRRGRDFYDTEKVENSLLKRALGYKYDETVKEMVDDPDTGEKLAVTKKTKKHQPGDVKAITFWLRNRNRKRWPDTKTTDGTLDVHHSHEQMLDELE